tara:strand:+ start:282 stop:509 length:228 start_codon:yes stop_codon:yes gene_type:complete
MERLELIHNQLKTLHDYRLKTIELKRDMKNPSWKNYKREMQKINDRLFVIDINEAEIMKKLGFDFKVVNEIADNN